MDTFFFFFFFFTGDTVIYSRQERKWETQIRRHDEGSRVDLCSMLEGREWRSCFITERHVANAEIWIWYGRAEGSAISNVNGVLCKAWGKYICIHTYIHTCIRRRREEEARKWRAGEDLTGERRGWLVEQYLKKEGRKEHTALQKMWRRRKVNRFILPRNRLLINQVRQKYFETLLTRQAMCV